MLQGPFVIELVDHQDAQFVAQLDEVAAVGVVAGAHVVHAKLLHQFQSLLDGSGVRCGT